MRIAAVTIAPTSTQRFIHQHRGPGYVTTMFLLPVYTDPSSSSQVNSSVPDLTARVWESYVGICRLGWEHVGTENFNTVICDKQRVDNVSGL